MILCGFLTCVFFPLSSFSGIVVPNAGANSIPVGIAVARQRLQHQETSMRNVSLSHHTSHHASYHHFQPDSFGEFFEDGDLFPLNRRSLGEIYLLIDFIYDYT